MVILCSFFRHRRLIQQRNLFSSKNRCIIQTFTLCTNDATTSGQTKRSSGGRLTTSALSRLELEKHQHLLRQYLAKVSRMHATSARHSTGSCDVEGSDVLRRHDTLLSLTFLTTASGRPPKQDSSGRKATIISTFHRNGRGKEETTDSKRRSDQKTTTRAGRLSIFTYVPRYVPRLR